MQECHYQMDNFEATLIYNKQKGKGRGNTWRQKI